MIQMAMNDEEKILRFLGLAARAGCVESGFDAVSGSILKNKVEVLIIARDISRNTLNKLMDLSSKTELPTKAYSFSTMKDLGFAIGKPDRALVAVLDQGFANKLVSMLDAFEYEEEDN